MRTKYPRTPHLPWSPGATSDDIRVVDLEKFRGRQVVVTEKLDGENSSLYRDGLHARSTDSRHHPSRDWLKGLHAQIAYEIPEGWRLCGENMFARHSVAYDDLESYFYLFSVWNEHNRCLSWQETETWAELLGLPTPRVLYRGLFQQDALEGLTVDTAVMEGFVVRWEESFPFESFAECVAKWVRPDHVQTDRHWMHAEIVPNGLRHDGADRGTES